MADRVREVCELLAGDNVRWVGIAELKQLLAVETEQTVQAWVRIGLLRSRERLGDPTQVLLDDVLRRHAENEALAAIGSEELTAEELNVLKRERPGINPWEAQ